MDKATRNRILTRRALDERQTKSGTDVYSREIVSSLGAEEEEEDASSISWWLVGWIALRRWRV